MVQLQPSLFNPETNELGEWRVLVDASDPNPNKNKKGVRAHHFITALFLRALHFLFNIASGIISVPDAKDNTHYLNQGSYESWCKRYGHTAAKTYDEIVKQIDQITKGFTSAHKKETAATVEKIEESKKPIESGPKEDKKDVEEAKDKGKTEKKEEEGSSSKPDLSKEKEAAKPAAEPAKDSSAPLRSDLTGTSVVDPDAVGSKAAAEKEEVKSAIPATPEKEKVDIKPAPVTVTPPSAAKAETEKVVKPAAVEKTEAEKVAHEDLQHAKLHALAEKHLPALIKAYTLPDGQFNNQVAKRRAMSDQFWGAGAFHPTKLRQKADKADKAGEAANAAQLRKQADEQVELQKQYVEELQKTLFPITESGKELAIADLVKKVDKFDSGITFYCEEGRHEKGAKISKEGMLEESWLLGFTKAGCGIYLNKSKLAFLSPAGKVFQVQVALDKEKVAQISSKNLATLEKLLSDIVIDYLIENNAVIEQDLEKEGIEIATLILANRYMLTNPLTALLIRHFFEQLGYEALVIDNGTLNVFRKDKITKVEEVKKAT